MKYDIIVSTEETDAQILEVMFDALLRFALEVIFDALLRLC